MNKSEAVSVIQRFLACIDTINSGCWDDCDTCRYDTNQEEVELALKLAVEALKGEVNGRTN